jgi:predicted transcriptional regulator
MNRVARPGKRRLNELPIFLNFRVDYMCSHRYDLTTGVVISGDAMNFKRKSLGRVELEVLQFVVENHPIRVKDVAAHMAETSGQARTTILTVLERLRQKKYLKRQKIDGVNHYSPTVSKAEFIQELVGDFVDGVLQGSVSPFVAYLNKHSQLSSDECEQLKQLVAKLDLQSKESPNE